MNTDIRLYVTFKGHRKRRRLRQLLGDNSTDYIIDLWLTVAQDRPEGVLTGWDNADVALAAGWEGDASVFVKALVSAGFLEQDGGVYSLHGWGEHQPWAVKAKERSEIGRQNAIARWDKCKPHANGMQVACNTQCKTNAKPCPSAPTPTPTPTPEDSTDSLQECVIGGMGETIHTPEDLNPLEEEMLNLQSWGKLTEADRQWIVQFTGDYPKTTDLDVRECGDYWYARAEKDKKVTFSKTQWKSRLRQWMKHKDQFGGNGATNIQGARGLPKQYTPAPINTRPLLRKPSV